jgi:hypothetical protein
MKRIGEICIYVWISGIGILLALGISRLILVHTVAKQFVAPVIQICDTLGIGLGVILFLSSLILWISGWIFIIEGWKKRRLLGNLALIGILMFGSFIIGYLFQVLRYADRQPKWIEALNKRPA